MAVLLGMPGLDGSVVVLCCMVWQHSLFYRSECEVIRVAKVHQLHAGSSEGFHPVSIQGGLLYAAVQSFSWR